MDTAAQSKLRLTPMGRFIVVCSFLLLLTVYLGILYLVMIGVVRACRAFDLPRVLGERWGFIPALIPFPVGLLVYLVARRCGYYSAVRRFIERRGYGVAA